MKQRMTSQRMAIQKVFIEQDRPLRIDEILMLARDYVDTLNRSTIYRNLKPLISMGWLRQINHPVLGILYEKTGKDHHHHFYCRICQRTFELPGCALNTSIPLPEGFVVEDHDIFLSGICGDCRSSPLK